MNRHIMEDYDEFMRLKGELETGGVEHQFFELSETDDYYELALVGGNEFTHWLVKGTADETDYLTNINPVVAGKRKICISATTDG